MPKTPPSNQSTRFLIAIPLTITTIRVIFAPVILIWAWNGRAGLPYIICLIIAFVTDYFDGVVARWLGVATAIVTGILTNLEGLIASLFLPKCPSS